MARPLRIEFSGALYHVTSRGNGREAIYLDDDDRQAFLSVLAEVVRRFNWLVHAYCMMDNHYHLLVETPDGNLAQGMRQLNGVYTQRFNRQHDRVGHVFQGRYKAILVDKDSYLLELARYIVLNPVRANMVRGAQEWPWSSYQATALLSEVPSWLYTDWIMNVFSSNRLMAAERYRRFVDEGRDQPSPWANLKNQIYLGTDTFIERMQRNVPADAKLRDIPAIQKRQAAKPLDFYAQRAGSRNAAIEQAYLSGAYSMKDIGDYFGLHYSRISRIIKDLEVKGES